MNALMDERSITPIVPQNRARRAVRTHLRLILMGTALCLAPVCVAAQTDDVPARARRLAAADQRPAAIKLLEAHLASHPSDDDARAALGTVLSWEGRYDEARTELSQVLARHPSDIDVRAALINVELWSSHPAEAKRLADQGLIDTPNNDRLLTSRRRAIATIDLARPWEVLLASHYDRFDDGRASWMETALTLRRSTGWGPILFRGSRAERFGLRDNQFEIEMYPQIRRGTYAYLSGGAGLDERLYPKYRFAMDIHQSIGAGFEASAGMRRLGFHTRADIAQLTINKYVGNWLLTARTFYVPARRGPSAVSYHGSARRYFGADGISYIGVRYGRGSAREEVRNLNDFEVLMSDTIAAELKAVIWRRIVLQVSGATSHQERIDRGRLRQHSISTAAGWRF